MTLMEYFNPVAIAAYWYDTASNRIPYMGEEFFPAKKKAGLDLKWIKGVHGLPISLMPSNFDAKATFRDREGFKVSETKMPFFREGFHVDEEDRQRFMMIENSNDPYVDQILSNLFDDVNNLIAGAEVVAERERMQLLFPEDGNIGITIKANGVDYTYNYDPNGEWKSNNYFALSGTSAWTASASANPISDFRTARKAVIASTGVDPTLALMNSTTFDLFMNMQSIKDRWLTMGGLTAGYLTENEVIRVLQDSSGITILPPYDKQYRDESGNIKSFVPDGYVALLPNHPVGSTYYGVTPEEADLRGRLASNSDVVVIDNKITITQILEPHPVNLNTYASEIVLPSFESMDEVALLKVIE